MSGQITGVLLRSIRLKKSFGDRSMQSGRGFLLKNDVNSSDYYFKLCFLLSVYPFIFAVIG